MRYLVLIYIKAVNRMSRTLIRVVPPDFSPWGRALIKHVIVHVIPTALSGWLGRVLTHHYSIPAKGLLQLPPLSARLGQAEGD